MSCTAKVNDSIIVVQDGNKPRRVYFKNPKKRKINKTKVDGCAIQKGKRCDFLLVDHKKTEYYVELKGKKIEEACDQITESIKKLSSDIDAPKYSFVICTRSSLSVSDLQKIRGKFLRDYNSSLLVKSNEHTHVLD